MLQAHVDGSRLGLMVEGKKVTEEEETSVGEGTSSGMGKLWGLKSPLKN